MGRYVTSSFSTPASATQDSSKRLQSAEAGLRDLRRDHNELIDAVRTLVDSLRDCPPERLERVVAALSRQTTNNDGFSSLAQKIALAAKLEFVEKYQITSDGKGTVSLNLGDRSQLEFLREAYSLLSPKGDFSKVIEGELRQNGAPLNDTNFMERPIAIEKRALEIIGLVPGTNNQSEQEQLSTLGSRGLRQATHLELLMGIYAYAILTKGGDLLDGADARTQNGRFAKSAWSIGRTDQRSKPLLNLFTREENLRKPWIYAAGVPNSI